MRGPRRRWWVAGVAVVCALAGAAAYLHWDSPLSRAWVEHALAEQYGVRARFGTFRSSLFPHARIEGTDLVVATGGEPLLRVGRITARADWWRLVFGSRHIGRVKLEGLVLTIPAERAKASGVARNGKAKPARTLLGLQAIEADGAVAVLESAPGEGPARRWEFQRLRLEATPNGLAFQTRMTLPKPHGDLEAQGLLADLQVDDPGATALRGTYALARADLGVFHGIAGHITARGAFQGSLRAVEVRGQAQVGDFALTSAGHPMPLRATFNALVDGATGATELRSVAARLRNSAVHVSGEVRPGLVDLLAVAGGAGHDARMEDFLELSSRARRPALRGAVEVHTEIRIPAGAGRVRRRLELNGRFQLPATLFSNPVWEAKLRSLSLRGRGQAKAAQAVAKGAGPPAGAPTRFHAEGTFRSARGLLRFPDLAFTVPGAAISLAGSYSLLNSGLDFHGHAALSAQPYQLATGWKSLLLRAVSPFLQHDANGTVVSVTVAGTREHPKFSAR